MTAHLLVRVSNLATSAITFRAFDPHVVVSLLDPGLDAPALKSAGLLAHLTLRLLDTDDIDVEQTRAGLRSILALCGGLAARREAAGRVLVHCNAGASRSTAVALFLLATSRRQDPEAAFAELLKITTKPWPNDVIVRLADELLHLDGALSKRLVLYKQQHPTRLQAYRRLNVRRGIVLTPYTESAEPVAGMG